MERPGFGVCAWFKIKPGVSGGADIEFKTEVGFSHCARVWLRCGFSELGFKEWTNAFIKYQVGPSPARHG